jgi:hypothetical protein
MKGIIALFLALIIANYAMAHGSHGSHGSGDNTGLSAGLEFGLHIHTHDDNDEDEEGGTELAPYAAITLSYSEGFFDDKLEFDIGLSYILNLKKGFFELEHEYDYDHSLLNEDFLQQVLCLNAGLTYSLDVTYFSTLSFILENDTDFYLVPRIGENNTEGELKPGLKWNWSLNFGDIYVRYDLPLQYVSYFDEEFGVGSDVSLGWQSKFGLGVDFVGRFALSPESGFDGVDAIVSYALPIKNFTLSIGCEFEGIGSEEGIAIVPAIGFTYTF